MKSINDKKKFEYRENAMTEPVCLVCGEHLEKHGYVYRGRPVCHRCVEYIRSNIQEHALVRIAFFCDILQNAVNNCYIKKNYARRNEMVFDAIKEIIANKIQVDEDRITPETSLMKDLEADSLDAVEIIMGIEEKFDIEIPDAAAEGFQNVGDIVKYVESQI